MSTKVFILSTLTLLFLSFVFYWIQVRPVIIKSRCYNTAYVLRPNEDNFEWAEGKKWLPKPGNEYSSQESYVWIYPDQYRAPTLLDRFINRDQLTVESNQKDFKKKYDMCLNSFGL